MTGGAQRGATAARPADGGITHDQEIDAIIGHLLTEAPSSHHEILRRIKMEWRETVQDTDAIAKDAGIAAKSSIVIRVGKLMLSTGTGAYRVEATMGHVGMLLGVSCRADVSLAGIDATVSDGHKSFTEVVSLPTCGVNTERIQLMECFMDELEEYREVLTVSDVHRMLDKIEKRKPRYAPWQLGVASGLACFAFVFLLGGGLIEMTGALVGAGFGNFVRASMGRRRFNQFGSTMVSVAVAGLLYLGTLGVISLFIPTAFHHEAGYIGALLFVIPGFPLITSGLDIAKLDYRSGIERLFHAGTIIISATLVGWLVASAVQLKPDDFAPLGLSFGALTALRLVASFVGVFGFSMMFNSPYKMCLVAAVNGAIANTLRLTLTDFGVPPEAAAFVGALTSGLLASIAGLRFGVPRISLTVPSIVIMVPGLYMYRAMFYMGIFDTLNALSWAIRAVMIVMCLPMGLGVARAITDPAWRKAN